MSSAKIFGSLFSNAPTSLWGVGAWRSARTFWNASGQFDAIWYQLNHPGIGALQQIINCASPESELVQIIGALALLAERSLRALRSSQRLRCSLNSWRFHWFKPLVNPPHQVALIHIESGPFFRFCQKVIKLTMLIWLLIKDACHLAMVLADMREVLTWDERGRKKRSTHLIVDIARLCDSIRYYRQGLRGDQEELDRLMRRIKAPFQAPRLLALFDHIDQIDHRACALSKSPLAL